MNNIEKAFDILNDTVADMDYTIEEIRKAHLLAIEALKKQLNSGWIPVKERLPKEGIAVLVSDKQGNVCVRAITCEIKGRKYWSQDKYDVLVWQPLPEKYKEVENE